MRLSESSTPTKESKSFGSEASTGVAASSPGNPGKRKDMSHLREGTPEFNHAELLESHSQLQEASAYLIASVCKVFCSLCARDAGSGHESYCPMQPVIEALAKAKEITG